MNQQSVSLNVSVRRTDEDSRLIEESVKGSKDAFKELFNKNVSKIHSLCLRISADNDAAEELTQLVFINAWEKLKSFRHECKFSTWLHRIAVNQYLMQVRSEKSKVQHTEQLSVDTVRSGTGKYAEQRMKDIQQEVRDQIETWKTDYAFLPFPLYTLLHSRKSSDENKQGLQMYHIFFPKLGGK